MLAVALSLVQSPIEGEDTVLQTAAKMFSSWMRFYLNKEKDN